MAHLDKKAGGLIVDSMCTNNHPETPMPRKTPPRPSRFNPVAKHAHHSNRAVVFRDRTGYARAPKHKGRPPDDRG